MMAVWTTVAIQTGDRSLDLENILKEVDRMVDGLDALGEEKLRLR
jgi:hypothetical protein